MESLVWVCWMKNKDIKSSHFNSNWNYLEMAFRIDTYRIEPTYGVILKGQIFQKCSCFIVYLPSCNSVSHIKLLVRNFTNIRFYNINPSSLSCVQTRNSGFEMTWANFHFWLDSPFYSSKTFSKSSDHDSSFDQFLRWEFCHVQHI